MTRGRMLTCAECADYVGRCEPDGDCLIWTGGYSGRGHPQVRVDGTTRLLRPLLVGARLGRLLTGPEVATTICGNKRCCAPEHLRRSTRGAVLAACYAAGGRQSARAMLARRRIWIAAGKAKLTLEAARSIRAEHAAGVAQCELARRHGVHIKTIWHVIHNRTWREVAANASVFAWRGAA